MRQIEEDTRAHSHTRATKQKYLLVFFFVCTREYIRARVIHVSYDTRRACDTNTHAKHAREENVGCGRRRRMNACTGRWTDKRTGRTDRQAITARKRACVQNHHKMQVITEADARARDAYVVDRYDDDNGNEDDGRRR